jgi:tetratricopeptide (TPR) repeat protein
LEAHALSILADTFRRTGRLVKARDALHRAIAVYRRGRDDEAWADAQNALGLVEWNAGQLETARECFQDAMSRMSGRSGPLKRGRVANNLGLLFEEAGRLTVARRYYERAFRIFDRLGHTRNRSYCLGNLGNLHRHAARYEHARNAYEEAQHEFRAIGEQHAAAYTTGNLGDLAFDFGNAQQALSLYQRTLEFAVSVGDLELVAESCARVASVHLAAGRADQARRFIRESHQAATQARSQEFLLRARLLAADLTTSDGKHADALHEYERAADDSTETGLLFYRLWAQYGRAHCALSGDRLIEAGEIAQAGSRDAHRAGYTWWELRFAVINARTQSHVSATHRRTKNAGTTLKRAVRLIDQIRRTIGETSVRGQFDRLPVVLTVNRIIDDTDRPDIARSHTADMPDLTL